MEPDGFLSISLIASFPRVRILTQDLNIIIESVKESRNVEVHENGFKVSFSKFIMQIFMFQHLR